MILNKEDHKAFLLEVLDAITIPTKAVDLFVEIREAVRNAEITPDAGD